jgi:acyl carrier protein
VEPETEIEKTIAALWGEILRVERVGAEDDFFALGGHSLLATKVMLRLRADLGIEMSMNRIFEASTVRRFAAQVESGLEAQLEAEREAGSRPESAGAEATSGSARSSGPSRAVPRRRRRVVRRS